MKTRAPSLVPLLAAALLLVVLVPAASAAAADDSFLPAPAPDMVQWADTPLYDRYPVWHYVYGSRSGSWDADSRVLDSTNLLQVTKAWLVKLSIRAVEYALFFDPVTPLAERAGKQMDALVSALWRDDGAPLVIAALTVAGMAALLLWVFRGRRQSGVWFLAGVAALVTGSYALFEAAPAVLPSSAGVARALGQELTGAVARVTAPAAGEGTSAERLTRAAGEAVWQALVMEPWVQGELSAAAAQNPVYADFAVPGGRWLAMTPSERAQRYRLMSLATQQTDLAAWDRPADHVPRRATIALASFLAALAFAGALLIIAAGVLFYQLAMVTLLVLGPLWLLLALWLPSGPVMARRLFLMWVGALVAQVTLMVVLAVLLGLLPALASLGSELGWFARGALFAVAAVVLCRYRFSWVQGRQKSRGTGERQGEAVQPRTPGRSASAAAREALRQTAFAAAEMPLRQREPSVEPGAAPVRAAASPPGRRAEPLVATSAAVMDFQHEMGRLSGRLNPAQSGPILVERERRPWSETAAPARSDEGSTSAPEPVRNRPTQGQITDSFREKPR